MIGSLNKQLELKAVEIADLLEVLNRDDDIPEGIQRRKDPDNFDQDVYKMKYLFYFKFRQMKIIFRQAQNAIQIKNGEYGGKK
ncbi:hypothetical protein INT47_008964 [Mucor saturninus]|uniref:Uncharacterized protein n=1 Tax=Mucor saturninus TaxID=64648 RepID=A0A8H7R301_9FUNG|nr:hypothetical protein INT47_008964 [Mucor saturninus]